MKLSDLVQEAVNLCTTPEGYVDRELLVKEIERVTKEFAERAVRSALRSRPQMELSPRKTKRSISFGEGELFDVVSMSIVISAYDDDVSVAAAIIAADDK